VQLAHALADARDALARVDVSIGFRGLGQLEQIQQESQVREDGMLETTDHRSQLFDQARPDQPDRSSLVSEP
jgi:hypothetical protein